MNKILNLIIIVGVLALVLLAAAVAYDNLAGDYDPGLVTQPTTQPSTDPTAETQSAPQSAPDFTVYDREGNAHKLSDFLGKPVVLNFWASWCGPCKSEMPAFDQAYKTYGQDVHFVMVNLTDGYQETVETAGKYLADSGYSFPAYYDTDMDATATYGVSSVPVTYFIDAQGYFVAMGRGALSAESLARGLEMLGS